MRQFAFRFADVYCQNLNNLKCTLALFLYANGKKGKKASSETEKESVRDCEHCGNTYVGVRHKTGCWKNPPTSFWDKLGRMNFFWETILMEEWDRKDTLRFNILKKCA